MTFSWSGPSPQIPAAEESALAVTITMVLQCKWRRLRRPQQLSHFCFCTTTKRNKMAVAANNMASSPRADNHNNNNNQSYTTTTNTLSIYMPCPRVPCCSPVCNRKSFENGGAGRRDLWLCRRHCLAACLSNLKLCHSTTSSISVI